MQPTQVTANTCYPSTLSEGRPVHGNGLSPESSKGSQTNSSNFRSNSYPVTVRNCDQRGKHSGIISPVRTPEASSVSKPRYQFRKVSTVLEACRDQHGQPSSPSSFSSDSLSDSHPMSKLEQILLRRNSSRSTASEKIQPLQDALDCNFNSDVEHARNKFSLLRFGRSTPPDEDDFFSRSQSGDFHLEPFTLASDRRLQPSLNSACHSACSSSDYSCQSNDSTDQLMLIRTPSLDDQLQSAGARHGANIKSELPPWNWTMQTPASVRRSLSRSKEVFMSTNSVRFPTESDSRPLQLDDEMEELSESNQPEPPKPTLKGSRSSSSLRKYFFESTGDSDPKTKGLRHKLSFTQHFSMKRSTSINSEIQPYIIDDQTEELSLSQFLTDKTESLKSPGGREPYRFPDHGSKQKEALPDPSPLPSPVKTKSTSGLFFWRRNKEINFSVQIPAPEKKKLKKMQISTPTAFRHINQHEDSQYFGPSIRDSCEMRYHDRTAVESTPTRSMFGSSVRSYTSTIQSIGRDTTHSRLLQPPPRPPRVRPVSNNKETAVLAF